MPYSFSGQAPERPLRVRSPLRQGEAVWVRAQPAASDETLSAGFRHTAAHKTDISPSISPIMPVASRHPAALRLRGNVKGNGYPQRSPAKECR